MEKIDYMIIGQGIAGTTLSYNILQRGKTCHVASDDNSISSSYISAGVINPVTGRRIVKSWMIDELMTTARLTYGGIGELLGENFITSREITKLLSDVEEENLWLSKMDDLPEYLGYENDSERYRKHFNDYRSVGKIKNALVVNIKQLLKSWEKFLTNKQLLIKARISPEEMFVENEGVRYRDVNYSKLIFADGHNGLSTRFFDFLPYKNAKGEVLHIRSRDYSLNEMIKGTSGIIPEGDTFWIGSNYEWDSKTELPSKANYNRILKRFDQMSKFEYEILSHSAGMRACSVDRRPYIGRHPEIDAFWIMNGLGTKGMSLAPYFSLHLLDHIEENKPLMKVVDIRRMLT